MGKGDMKSRKGKLTRGSFGVRRPKRDANKISRKVKLGIIRRKAN
jgi:30S ribosomal protein S31